MRYSRFVRRIAVTGEASVRSCATEDSDDGTLLDLSRKGARLCISRVFQPGQKLMLMLNLPWDEPPVEVHLATVKWAHQGTVGVEFLKVENDERVSLDVFLASRSTLPALVLHGRDKEDKKMGRESLIAEPVRGEGRR